MFISIDKTGSGRYVFSVGDDPSDPVGSRLSSYADAAVLGDIPTTFASFGEAHSYASRLVDERPSCILAKKAVFYRTADSTDDDREMAEGKIISHYLEQVDIIGQRIVFLRDTTPDDFDNQLVIVTTEVEEVKGEIKRLAPLSDGRGREIFDAISERLEGFSGMIEQLSRTKKTASVKSPMTIGLQKAAIRAFSEAAILAVKPSHDDVFVRGATFLPKTSTYESVLATPKGDLVRLSFDRNLLLSGVFPCGQSQMECGGIHSGSFFLRYWEPIVNSVGHFHSKGHSLVAVAGLDLSRRDRMKAFSILDNSEAELSIGRPVVMGRRTWILGKVASKMTEPPRSPLVVGDEAECLAEHLPTYHGRTGFISEVAQKTGRILYRVDFRRGIGPIWLEDKHVRKVDLGL